MNSAKLKSMVSKKSKGDNNMSIQLYQMFFFEHILERLSKSEYKHNIILKGGLLLASIVGEDLRTTKDMDASLKSIPLNKENILKMFEEILSIDIEDNITYEIVGIKDIREEDEYGGFQINILGTLENTKINMFIEVSTGDIITPKEIEFNYKCIFEEKIIPICAYTIETIIAEKLETFISRNIANTRMKDYYDLYMLVNDYLNTIDQNALKEAIRNTFNKRETKLDSDSLKKDYELIKTDAIMQQAWLKYKNKNKFVKDVDYIDVMKAIGRIIDIV